MGQVIVSENLYPKAYLKNNKKNKDKKPILGIKR